MPRIRHILPPELIEIIVDYLHDDVFTLKACSLVGKAWHPTARYYLFTSIHLDLSLPPKSLKGFLQHIARPKSFFHVTLRHLFLRSEAVPQRHHDLSALSSLRNLTSISLSCWYNTMPDPHWFLGSRNVTRLEFASCRIERSSFREILRQLPKIEVLKLANVSWMDRFSVGEATECSDVLKHLRKLHLGPHSSSVIPALSALISKRVVLGKVREIVLEDVEMRYEKLVGNLLVAAGPTLHSLTISAKNKLSK
ncbi:hypothetical protein H0H87_002573 [Tephrocybe sp. NHM501043]|nr:hypothetical protein H0H87_002573 [Tephrocybe sp. NHM501043]